MRQRIKYLVALLIIATIALSTFFLQTSSAKDKPKVVFILVDNITWSDIVQADDKFFNELIEKSSIGLLNNRTYGRPSRPRGTLSVGAGVRANTLPDSLNGYNASEERDSVKIADTFFVRTGKRVGPDSVVELGLSSIIADNEKIRQDIVPGALGQILNDNGYKTAVLGNSDSSFRHGSEYNNREIVDIAMNASGIVDYGNVGKDLLVKDPTAPYGLRTNEALLLEQFKNLLHKADFIAVDYGDTTRVDLYTPYVMKEQAIKLRSEAIRRAGSFTKHAMEAAGNDTVFILASLSPPGSGKNPVEGSKEQLTLAIINGPGFGSGSLKSATTKRVGMIGNTDITKTILNIFGLKPHYTMVGNVAEVEAGKVDVEQLIKFNDNAIGIKDARRIAVLSFIYLQIAVYLVAALLLLWRREVNKRYIRFLETLILTAMAFPLFSFLTSKIDVLAVNGAALTAATLVASLTVGLTLGVMRQRKFMPLAVICGATLVTLVVDVFLGAQLQLNSIFGYDPIRGSRYFGIGNEAMSILLATSLLMAGLAIDKWKGYRGLMLASLIALAIIFVDGFPTLGADVGGIIAFVVAFTAMWVHFKGIKLDLKSMLIIFAAIASALTAFVAYDVMSEGSTHMGESIRLISDGGASQILLIIERKLAMNIKVLKFSTWSYFLVVILLLAISLSYRPVGLLKKLFSNYRGLAASVMGATVGGVVGFAVNDSGILIPAITMSYVFPFIVYLMLWEKYRTA